MKVYAVLKNDSIQKSNQQTDFKSFCITNNYLRRRNFEEQ